MAEFTNEEIRRLELYKKKEQARFRRIVHRIEHMRKMECERMNFSPDILKVYDNILAYAATLDREASILR